MFLKQHFRSQNTILKNIRICSQNLKKKALSYANNIALLIRFRNDRNKNLHIYFHKFEEKMKTPDRKHPAFRENAEPFYQIIMEGLKGEVDGGHFWDAVAEDAIFEFLYNFEGFPNKIEGRKAYMDWFGNYTVQLHSADNLSVYKTSKDSIIVLEYEVHGTIPHTGKAYDNRFCSIITIKDRKIIHWRDYMDSLAVMLANS